MSDVWLTPRRLIVFDWDGTLVNTLPRKVAHAGLLLGAELGVDAQKIEQAYRRHSGIPRRALFDAIARDVGFTPLDDETYDRASRAFSQLNRNGLGPHMLFPDTVDTLIALRSCGCAVAVSSAATDDEVEAGVHAMGLAGLLDAALGSDGSFTKGGPHLAFLRERFAAGEAVWLVGDEAADIRLGREAGVRTIARLGTCARVELASERPDVIVETLSQIPWVVGCTPAVQRQE